MEWIAGHSRGVMLPKADEPIDPIVQRLQKLVLEWPDLNVAPTSQDGGIAVAYDDYTRRDI